MSKMMEHINHFGDALESSSVESHLRVFPGAGHAFVHRPLPAGRDMVQKALQEMVHCLSKTI